MKNYVKIDRDVSGPRNSFSADGKIYKIITTTPSSRKDCILLKILREKNENNVSIPDYFLWEAKSVAVGVKKIMIRHDRYASSSFPLFYFILYRTLLCCVVVIYVASGLRGTKLPQQQQQLLLLLFRDRLQYVTKHNINL